VKKIGYISIPLIIIIAIFLTSKEETIEDRQGEIDRAIKEKVDVYVQSRRADCMGDVMKEADRRADSILQIKALEMFSQKISVDSSRIFRPGVPEITVPTDSIPIEPLFKDSLQSQ
jgi:hypothetical protein